MPTDIVGEIHPDKESFEAIWEKIISVYIDEFIQVYTPNIEMNRYAKEDIWDAYVKLNLLCKQRYMKDLVGKLDRHKVASCYILAVALSRPLRMKNDFDDKDQIHNISNELLAISVGFSVLCAYVESAIRSSKNMTEDEKKCLLNRFSNGIVFPDGVDVNHGNYIVNFANEIYYAVEDGNYNILSLSHELYLLEIYTKTNNRVDSVESFK